MAGVVWRGTVRQMLPTQPGWQGVTFAKNMVVTSVLTCPHCRKTVEADAPAVGVIGASDTGGMTVYHTSCWHG